MGYQALLFCPEEKTARTVTQVLTELDFNVEACNEPFAAVKKLMGQHFDAVVVDCDNEQNATLLFKSARNSSSNQTSLAVAVVEGQAGVAKAFRIGANLVLTKPINIEQAKGTLRVARGLLRKSEPGKATASATPATPKPAAPKPISAVKPAAAAPAQISTPRPAEIPAVKPAAPPAWPAVPAANSAPVAKGIAKDIEPLEIDLQEPDPTPITAPAPSAAKSGDAIPAASIGSPVVTGRAASAPAPARIPDTPEKPAANASADLYLESRTAVVQGESSAVIGSAPSFTFGGANTSIGSSGSKKIVFGVAAVVILAVAAYFAWTQFQGHPSQTAPASVAPATVTKPQLAKPAATQPSSAAVAPATSAPVTNSVKASAPATISATDNIDSTAKTNATQSAPVATKPLNSAPSASAKTDETVPAEAEPMIVKSGKVPGKTKSEAADAPAPSLIGIAAPGEAAPPADLIAAGNGFKPVLQTLNVSQGVSQGLLVKKVNPSYPPNALRMGIEGSVQLMATISKDGDISHIKVLSGDAQLTKAASDAVKQWKYKPYLLNGEPVEIQTQITVNFKLPK